jgi:hypothetical protein
LTLFFYGEIDGEPEITPEYVSECKWFDKEEAANLDLGFDHKKILKKYLEKFS